MWKTFAAGWAFNLSGYPLTAFDHAIEARERVIATYTSLEQARLAREELVQSIPHLSGYVEGEDFYWIAYGAASDEVLLFIEPVD